MGIVSRMLAQEPRGPLDDYWYTPLGLTSSSGVKVDADAAEGVSAVFACVNVIAETLASLPLVVYQRLPNGGRRRAPEHPLYGVLATRPNNWQTSFEFREMMFAFCALRGNAYAHILPGPRGFADQLVPIHPDRVRVERVSGAPNAPLRYWVRQKDGQEFPFNQNEIFHLRRRSRDGLTGMSIIEVMREAVGVSLAAESYGARVFSQDASPRGALLHPGKLSDEAIERLRATWHTKYAGLSNAHSTAVLTEGMDWKQVGMTSEDAQFLETRRFQAEEVARFFRMQPHKIGILDKATFSNIEQQAIEHVTDTLRPWAVRFEQVVSRDLILAPQTYYAEFLFEGLMRGDTLSRFQAYQIAAGGNAPWMSRAEIRELENMDPRPELDSMLAPLNMTQVGATRTAQTARARMLALQVAARIVRKEEAAVRKAAVRYAADGQGWHAWLDEFYGKLAADDLAAAGIEQEAAVRYARARVEQLGREGVAAMADWEPEASSALARLILGEAEDADIPDCA
ncbi:MAG TPA: phage portal protein [Burkholderiales bacterium]|nr:phage portal protein [Burkholderiales bacterium]